MARDWSKSRRRAQSVQTVRAMQECMASLEPVETGPSKADMRAETEALVAAFAGPVRRLPTYAALRCRSCGHRGNARVGPGQSPRFKCSDCGSSLVAWRL